MEEFLGALPYGCLSVIIWLDVSGESKVCFADIVVMQHRLLSDMLTLEELLNSGEESRA